MIHKGCSQEIMKMIRDDIIARPSIKEALYRKVLEHTKQPTTRGAR